jgi:hypothetical protein
MDVMVNFLSQFFRIRVELLRHCIVPLPGKGLSLFLISNVSSDNITLCRGQYVVSELQVGRPWCSECLSLNWVGACPPLLAENSSHNNPLKHFLVYDDIYRALFRASSALNEVFRHGKRSCPTYAEFLFKYVVKLWSARYWSSRKRRGNSIFSHYLN